MRLSRGLLALVVLVWAHCALGQGRRVTANDSTKSNYRADLKMGNPTNKDVELELNDYTAPYYRYDLKYSNGWFDFKKKLNDNAGFQLSLNYTGIYMGATSRIAEENVKTAGSGIFDATLKWNFINRKKDKNKGSLIWWVDWRHLYYGEVAPQFLFLETGAANLSATKFNKWRFHTLEFYYQQQISERLAIVIGKIDMPDWFTFNGLAHPMLHFTDLAFSVNPTVSWSNPGFGIVAGGWLDKKKRFGLVAGLNDVAGVDLISPRFFDLGTDQWANGNFLKMVEFAYTPERALYYFNRLSITYWHSDELMMTDDSFFTSPSSRGFTVQGTWVIDERLIPVTTFGLSDGDGANALSKLNISLANGWYFPNHDMVGVGLNYTTSTITDRSQLLYEIFYRFTWSKTTAITPLVKFVLNPALDPDRDFLMYYGVRGRISI